MSFGISVALFAGLQWCPAGASAPAPRKKLLASVAAILALCAIPAFVVAGAASKARPADPTAARQYVVLEPTAWVGERLPLLPQLSIDEKLSSGDWTVLLYRDDCPDCVAAIPRYERLAREAMRAGEGPRVALVEMPPYGGHRHVAMETACVLGRLDKKTDWFVDTPLELTLHDGVVLAASAGGTAESGSPEIATEIVRHDIEPVPSEAVLRVDSGGDRVRSFPDYRRARRERFLDSVACGPLALIAVLKHLDVPLSADDEAELIALAGSKGTNMAQLSEAAERFGVSAPGVAVPVDELARIGLPAIVHLDEATFAAVLAYQNDGVRVVYPLGKPILVRRGEFEKRFGRPGRALLLSRTALSAEALGIAATSESATPASGPRLRLSGNVVAIGRIFQHSWSGSLTLHNDGDAPLTIDKVVDACGCMKPRLSRPVIAPGGSETLFVSGRQEDFGRFSRPLILVTNQADAREVVVPVRGYLESPIVCDRPSAVLEGVAANSQAETDVPIEIDAAVGTSDVVVSVPPVAPIEARLATNDSGRSVLRIRWLGKSRPGWHRYELKLGAAGLVDSARLPIHVAVQVVPAVAVVPPVLFIGEDDFRAGWERVVTLRGTGGVTIANDFEWVGNESGWFTVTPENSGESVRLRIVARQPGASEDTPVLPAVLRGRDSLGAQWAVKVHLDSAATIASP